MSRLSLAVTLALLGLPLAACSSDGYDATTGSLRVEIDGVPVGVAGVVDVSGPDGFSRPLTVSTTLTTLTKKDP